MAFVRASSGFGVSDGGLQTSVPCPTGAQVGDILSVCHMVDNDNAGVAAMTAVSPGFTERAAYTANAVPRLKLWTKQLVAADLGQSFTFQHNNAVVSGYSPSSTLVALSCGDVDPDTPLISTPSTASRTSNSSNLVANTITGITTGTLSVVVGCGLRYNTADAGAQFFTPPTNWIERWDTGQPWMKPTVYTRDNITGVTATGAANAVIASSAASSGQATLHVALRHKTYVAPTPTGPDPDQFLPFFGR